MNHSKPQRVSQLQGRVTDVTEQADKMANNRDFWIDGTFIFMKAIGIT